MKKKSLLLGAVLFIFTGIIMALPAGRDVYFGSHYDGTEVTYYKDGTTIMPGLSALQPVVAGANEVNNGVSTNYLNNYLNGDDTLYAGGNSASTLVTDPLLGGYADGSGEWNTRIGGGDTETGGNKYYVRLFSHQNIPDAAYYYDTSEIIGSFPTQDSTDFSDISVSTVNPAYDMVFDTAPVSSPGSHTIVGSVDATISGGNNQLESGFVLIEYRYSNSAVWVDGTLTLDGTGGFSFNVPEFNATSVYVRARIKDANTPLNGFPFTSEYLINLDRSPIPFVNITNDNVNVDYDISTYEIGGSNNVDTVGMLSWANSLGGNGTQAVGTPWWTLSGTSLGVGANVMTVT